jgi:hypothetical protein
VGAYQAVEVAARALRAAPPDARLSFLTLGQNIPFASFHPAATGLRQALADLIGDARVDWVDVSSPRDWLGHILVDVTLPSDVPSPADAMRPKVVSSRWGEIFTKQRLWAVQFDWFELHFHFLYANDHPGDWDWFRVVCGPQRLADRFAHRDSAPQADRLRGAW